MKYDKEFLEKIVKKSNCIWDVVEQTDMSKQEGNFHYISKLIKKFDIDKSHFIDQRIGHKKGKRPIEEYLVKNKYLTLNGNTLKKRLYDEGFKIEICEICGQNNIWKGIKISLILDHKDGDRNNNDITNLQIVCPNCNATLDTHCGKNKIKKEKIIQNKKPKNLTTSTLERIELIKNSNIDFNVKTWGTKISKLLDYSPQYSIKFVKKHWDLIKEIRH